MFGVWDCGAPVQVYAYGKPGTALTARTYACFIELRRSESEGLGLGLGRGRVSPGCFDRAKGP